MNDNKGRLGNFVPMTEEEQKDFFYLLLDTMDEAFYKIANAKTKDEGERFERDYALYVPLASFFEDDPKWMKETPYSTLRFLRNYAKGAREAYDGAVKKA